MSNLEKLIRYLSDGIVSQPIGATIGVEVETSFVDEKGEPITVGKSQEVLRLMCDENGWKISKVKGELVAEIVDSFGNRILYELGRQNLEFAAAPSDRSGVYLLGDLLKELYKSAQKAAAFPVFKPVLETRDDLLIIQDEGDATWRELDGREALELLARISAVQFTISVPSPGSAIGCLNMLGENIGKFLRLYPQEEYWRRYINESKANYHALRYGGPLFFKDLKDYCEQLAKHDVVVGPKLVPFEEVENLDIPLFLRSIWWYFRLKRYGDNLCIEVRPLGRWDDRSITYYLWYIVLDTLKVVDWGYSEYSSCNCNHLPDPKRPESY